VFSFDGDAAGRRAAARALEAALPHATDLRSVKFLFLPPEHDPDSYVRDLGREAFEAAVTMAVPLSRQLLELAAEGCDLTSAEGRARMLAQAKPLWSALPDGALKRQLLPDIARQGGLEPVQLSELWGQPVRRAQAPQGPLRLLRSGTIRVPPAGPSDVALRLLLQHAEWWDQLSPDEQQMLHELGAPHGEVIRWLEGQLMEHGALTWSALDDAMHAEPWAETARAWVRAGLGDEAHQFDELQRILSVLLQALLKLEADGIAASEPTQDDLVRYREIMEQIAVMKALRTARTE
jgi:DNA primase